MPNIDASSPQHTSDILASLAHNVSGDGDVTVREILCLLEGRVFGLAILLLCLPNLLPIPNPPGLSGLTGIPIMLLALQMSLGKKVLWVPKRMANYTFSRERFSYFLAKSIPAIRRVEKLLHPRLHFMQSDIVLRLLGLLFFLLGLVMSLPIPFANFLPGIAMALIAIGLLERDGFVMAAGIAVSVFATTFIVSALEFAFNTATKFFSG